MSTLNLKKDDIVTYKVTSIGNKVENVVDKINEENEGGKIIYFQDGHFRLVKDIRILILNNEPVVMYSDIRDGMVIKDREDKNWTVSMKLYGYCMLIGKKISDQVPWVQKDFDRAMFRKVED